MKTSMTMIAALGLTVLATGAIAGGDFEKYDTDGDGTISLSESKANPRLMGQFKDLDSNGDSLLSKSEFSGFNS
ncbi:EF-hand domain-containing protein [Pseudoalteromonas sp. DL2-H2.2]|uniref:EF-hand domain-containing protein n=1 Tax=Pseudoalteromonas sp. DL2-H2.2 TaxID=2908889 RepID=UPI001F25D8C4|nr:EF-hand domain-containing protein [Pseudoalteromonas sp. DL2-H2.2]MCF2910527.1 EF-hand domain-containing protein [Pseudoalteromonas sp. DL2-H2.2]